jgi:transposase-like protein
MAGSGSNRAGSCQQKVLSVSKQSLSREQRKTGKTLRLRSKVSPHAVTVASAHIQHRFRISRNGRLLNAAVVRLDEWQTMTGWFRIMLMMVISMMRKAVRTDREGQRTVSVIIGGNQRRLSGVDKAKITAARFGPGANIAAVAREHGVSQGLLHDWRRCASAWVSDEQEMRFVPFVTRDEELLG